MRLPRLPVSRRRHEADIDFIMRAMGARTDEVERQRDEAREQRDHLAQRVAELIEERRKAGERRDELMAERDDARLRANRLDRALGDAGRMHAPCRNTEDHLRGERDEAQAALRSVRDQRDEWVEEAWQRGQKLREVRKQRNEAWARAAELEQAIRSHRDHQFPEGDNTPVQRFEQAMAVNRKLWSVLDGHDRDSYVGADPDGPCDSPWKVPVANVDSCQRCGHPVDGHDRQERTPECSYCSGYFIDGEHEHDPAHHDHDCVWREAREALSALREDET